MVGVSIEGLDDAAALDCIALLVDRATDTRDSDLTNRALALSEQLSARGSLAGEQELLLHYFRANAFQNKLQETAQTQTWSWEIPHFDAVILELRRAVRHEAFASVGALRQCQILTNLGGKLNSVGRPVEALTHWDRAIALDPQFAMALGNRGQGLGSYANALYDGGHSSLLLLSAYDCLTKASDRDARYDSRENLVWGKHFAAMAAQIAGSLNLKSAREDLLREFSLGQSPAEQAYRAWALDKRLFLSPLNDLGSYSVAARDVLHLPSLTTGIEVADPGPPPLFGFYNQLKQEFVSARWLCFEGLTEHQAHFSDGNTHLYDTLNIPAYSLAVEKTKAAFRMAYSLFDKIAFFINDYFEVGLPEKTVNFRSVWYERKGEPKPLSSIFKDRENWPLRGLYWLSKDIYDPSFQEVSEPDAEGLADLRNYLEHKYCQVHEDLGIGYSQFSTARNGSKVGFYIGRDMLETKTLHILKKSRAALIYLSLAVHREENVRNVKRDGKRTAFMPLSTWRERGRL